MSHLSFPSLSHTSSPFGTPPSQSANLRIRSDPPVHHTTCLTLVTVLMFLRNPTSYSETACQYPMALHQNNDADSATRKRFGRNGLWKLTLPGQSSYQVSSPENVAKVFRAQGMLMTESHARSLENSFGMPREGALLVSQSHTRRSFPSSSESLIIVVRKG